MQQKTTIFNKSFPVMLLLLLLGMQAYAQHAPAWNWAVKGDCKNDDLSQGVATDASGNTYITGYFFDTLQIGTHTLICNGGHDIFIAKYDASGNPIWAKNIGGRGWDKGLGITVGKDGAIYVTGYYSDTVDFGAAQFISKGETDIFLAKYDANGNIQWAKTAGSLYIDEGYQVGTDAAGNVFICGDFAQTNVPPAGSPPTADFGNIQVTTYGLSDVFVAKYDTNGNEVWVRTGGSPSSDEAVALYVDNSGSVVITGDYETTAHFGTETLTYKSWGALFVVKYDNNGDVKWARGMIGSAPDYVHGIACDAADNIYVVGNYESADASFGSTKIPAPVSADFFVLKCNGANGNLEWFRNSKSIGNDEGMSFITINSVSDIFIGGRYSNLVVFGNDTLKPSDGGAFIAKYDTSGNAVWAKPTAAGLFTGLAIDNASNIIATGWNKGPTAVFDNHILTGNGSYDMFLAKLNYAALDVAKPLKTQQEIGVYPNPSNDKIYISEKGIKYDDLYIVNCMGKVVYRSTKTTEVDVSALPAGIYYVKLENKANVAVRKIMVNK